MRAPLALLVLLRAAAPDAALGKTSTCRVINWPIVRPGELDWDPRGVERVATTIQKTERDSTFAVCQSTPKKTLTLLAAELLVAQPATGDARVAPRAASIAIVKKKEEKRERKKQRKERCVFVSCFVFGKNERLVYKNSKREKSYKPLSVVREPVQKVSDLPLVDLGGL